MHQILNLKIIFVHDNSGIDIYSVHINIKEIRFMCILIFSFSSVEEQVGGNTTRKMHSYMTMTTRGFKILVSSCTAFQIKEILLVFLTRHGYSRIVASIEYISIGHWFTVFHCIFEM